MTDCPHIYLTFFGRRVEPADEPPYLEGRLICNDCGEPISLDDAPEGAIIRDRYGNLMEWK